MPDVGQQIQVARVKAEIEVRRRQRERARARALERRVLQLEAQEAALQRQGHPPYNGTN